MRNRSFMVMAITAMLLMVQVPNLLFAQKSINDFKKELEQNIYDLDLIEGLYNVTVKVEAYAPRIGWDSRTQNFTAVVRAHPDEKGKFFLIALKGDAEGLIGIIQKAGGNGYYICCDLTAFLRQTGPTHQQYDKTCPEYYRR